MNIPTTADFLNRAQKAIGASSDYQLWKQTGIAQSAISDYRQCKRAFDDKAIVVFSDITGENPMAVLAASNYQRASKDPRKAKQDVEWWAHKYATFTGFELVDDVRNSEDNHETK